ALRDRAELRVDAEDLRTVQAHDLDGLDGAEAGLDEQLVVALVAEAGQRATDAGGVDARREQPAGARERELELLRPAEHLGHDGGGGVARELLARAHVLVARLGRHGVQYALL